MKFSSLRRHKADNRVKNETTKEELERESVQPIVERSQPQADTKKRLYVYCIVPAHSCGDYGKIGVKDDTLVRTIEFKDIAAVVSDFLGDSFEENDANVIAHERVVQKVLEQKIGIPEKFGMIRENEDAVRIVLEERYHEFSQRLTELASKWDKSTTESTAGSDIIAEVLSQSAASAVRIRQLTDTLDNMRRTEYERGAEKLPQGTLRELLDFLAKAPASAYQASNTLTASPEQIHAFEQRLDSLFEEIKHVQEMIAGQTNPECLERQHQEAKDAVMSVPAFQDENKVVLGRAASEATTERSNESPARDVMVETPKEQHLLQQTAFGIDHTPNPTDLIESYLLCQGCGAGIAITDRFCPYCGGRIYQGNGCT